ncbi:ribulose-bisphosphate carboxylase large subunit [Candidatus Micrarchaeota archaeon RBG_16_36_9]|nr:MAG: ribulose-bisphosphate carboxylase large subunit [Candidatus Micrarchaeota archaeon RBG_16_36_9]
MSYIDLKYKSSKDDLICLFRVEPAGKTIKEAAENIAAESSIGTWTDVKTMKPGIKKLGAKVFEIKGKYVKIAYPLELFEPGNMPQILSSIAGNIFGMKSVKNLRLEDIDWPNNLISSFKGPLYGINGIRKILKIPKRPLCGTIIKPKLGLNEEEHAKVAYDAWVGGMDIVKDDENLSNQSFNHFTKRVEETLKMRNNAEQETGERKVYMPNISAETDTMLERANFVKEIGGEYAMVDILTVGWSALQNLRTANEDLKLVLHAHRAGHAAFTRNKKHGISMVVIGDIARLIGVDQLHIGTVIGKMEGIKEEILTTEDEIENKIIRKNNNCLAEDWLNIKPVFAVCSGGLHPGLVPYLVKTLSNDIIIQAGGGIHGHKLGTTAGARAMRQAIDATLNKVTLKEYSKNHKELNIALKQWM